MLYEPVPMALAHLQIKLSMRASLVVKWLRIYLAMQGRPVQSLVWENPTCLGAPKSKSHNYCVHVQPPLKPVHLEPVLCNKRSPRDEKPTDPNRKIAPTL